MTDITVSFACNDSRGKFTERFDCVEFSTDGMDPLATLARLFGRDRALKRLGSDRIRVSGRQFKITSYRCWEGNWCWNAVTMSVEDARALFRKLKASGWQLDEWAETGPLADLVRESIVPAKGDKP